MKLVLKRERWYTNYGQCVIILLLVERAWASCNEGMRWNSGAFFVFFPIIYSPVENIHSLLYNGFFNTGQVVFTILFFFLLFGVVEIDGLVLVAS